MASIIKGEQVKRLVKWIIERQRIYLVRKMGMQKKPWTKDPILQQYRFCNVYREQDTVTMWIAKHWRAPHEKEQLLWFAFVLARLVNWPATLQRLEPCINFGLNKPMTWKPALFQSVMRSIQEQGGKAWGGAYIVSTNGRKMLKEKYIAEQVLTPMWQAKGEIYLLSGEPLRALYDRLSKFQGMGSFLAAQVVADSKYLPALRKAPDWWTFAASGPGSRRGLNRVIGSAPDAPWREHEWHKVLTELAETVAPMVAGADMSRLHNQDLQNCLCEFDKYERTRLGEGRPRATYPGR